MINLRNRILNFEHWIASDFKLEEPKYFQRELLKLFEENTDAYSYYRNFLFEILFTNKEKKELEDFRSFADNKKGTKEYQALLKYYLENNSADIFSIKRNNVFEIAHDNNNKSLNHNHCFLYQQYYEIEIIFLVLSSFIKLNSENVIETEFNNFKDRSGRLKKGAIIDYLKSKLTTNSDLKKLFDIAYNPKIRNIIGHNNYKIKNDAIVSLDGKESVSKIELFKSLESIQRLNNYLLNYFSANSIEADKLKNCGVLGIAFGYENTNPVMNAFQLSCFYNLNDKFEWLNKVSFKIINDKLETNLGSSTKLTGVFEEELNNNWFKSIEKESNLKVYMTPIQPRNKGTDLVTLDVGDFEIIDEGKGFDLNYEIKKCKL